MWEHEYYIYWPLIKAFISIFRFISGKRFNSFNETPIGAMFMYLQAVKLLFRIRSQSPFRLIFLE